MDIKLEYGGHKCEVSTFACICLLVLACEKSDDVEVCQIGPQWKEDCFDLEHFRSFVTQRKTIYGRRYRCI